MRVFVSQLYIQAGVAFPFRHRFQEFLSRTLSESLAPSPLFKKKYGEDYDLIFRMSAKEGLAQAEIKGPTSFERDKDVEFTVFLPFNKNEPIDHNVLKIAVSQLISCIVKIANELEISTTTLSEQIAEIVDAVMNDARMIRTP